MQNDYLEIRQEMTQLGYDNSSADDVKDFFVFATKDYLHLTDAQLEQTLVNYRNYETAHPEYVQRGDAFIAH